MKNKKFNILTSILITSLISTLPVHAGVTDLFDGFRSNSSLVDKYSSRVQSDIKAVSSSSDKTVEKVKTASEVLESIIQESNLDKTKYNNFKSKVDTAVSEKEYLDSQVNQLADDVNKYTQALTERANEIKNPKYKDMAMKKINTVKSRLKPKIDSVKSASKQIDPYIQELKDILALIQIDFSTQAIKGKEDLANKLKGDFVALKQKTNALKIEGDKIISEMK